MRWSHVLRAAVLGLVLASSAGATVYNVNSIPQFQAALAAVNPGDEIRLAYNGNYQVLNSQDHQHWFTRNGTLASPIRIVGQLGPNGEKPAFDATGANIDRGIFYMWPSSAGAGYGGSHYVIEDVEFRNARGSAPNDPNAAAAYIRGDNVTFRRCYSHHNDNGFTSSSDQNAVVFENCEVCYNGNPIPGYHTTHNFYMSCAYLTVRGCHIHHSTEGQNFKSRARNTIFAYNYVHDDNNYSWELASGNDLNALMIGNVMVKGFGAASHKFIGLGDGSGGATTGTLTMINNTFISTFWLDFFFGPHTSTACNVVMYNNIFAGPSKLLTQAGVVVPMTGSNNWFHTGSNVPATVTASLFGNDPYLVNAVTGDYSLLPVSPCKNAGTSALQWLNAQYTYEAVTPTFEPMPLLNPAARPVDGAFDIGAFEALTSNPPVTGTQAAADFDDGTWGDLDVQLPVSTRTIDLAVLPNARGLGLPDADNELYLKYGYGAPGNDGMVIDGHNLFGDVNVSAVVGFHNGPSAGARAGGAGVAAGSLTTAGCGYLLYLVYNWGDGAGDFYDSTVGGANTWQMVLVRKDQNTVSPLRGNPYQAVKVLNFVQDFPHYLRLSVNGTQIKGELWKMKTAPSGNPDYTLTMTDPNPLQGYAGVYLCGRTCNTDAASDYGIVAVDDFQAVSTAPVNRTLTTNVDGQGTVQLSPAGGSYPQGSSVELTAVPAAGKWAFVCWQGGLTGTTNPANVVMDADKTVTAVFRVPGDVTGEGDVDVVDLLYLVDAFGSVSGDANYSAACDFNGDESVDVVDLLTLVETFGTIGGE